MLLRCLEFFSRQKDLCTGIDSFSQRLARFEMRNALFRNGDAFARTRISAYARGAAVDRKAAKTANLYPVSAYQCIAHSIKNRLDGKFGIAVRQLAESGGQFFYKITSGHAF